MVFHWTVSVAKPFIDSLTAEGFNLTPVENRLKELWPQNKIYLSPGQLQDHSYSYPKMEPTLKLLCDSCFLILATICILCLVCSLQSAFYHQSAFYIWSTVGFDCKHSNSGRCLVHLPHPQEGHHLIIYPFCPTVMHVGCPPCWGCCIIKQKIGQDKPFHFALLQCIVAL